MQDYEKLGVFYLGRMYDLAARTPREDLLLYDAKDLTTHAVCVGMTGSGKTGLCLSLLEEAAIDGIPAICIDPKGDLGNLLLTFPELRPEDFKPWLEPAEATRQGLTLDELAKRTAANWKTGLDKSGQPPERIARFRDAAEISIYTPGSNAGLPLTVVRSFDAPPPEIQQNSEALRERITSAASGLLALLGIDADPLQSREHILLSSLFDHAWKQGQNVDLGGLIRLIQSPPFTQVGFLDLESFYPQKDRFGLAMRMNNLLASPGFANWLSGEPLDIQRLLYTPAGKPRVSILSIAHLSDAERMFFVTILLNEMVSWMRRQSGTTSLRAILYMDEVFGYFPPTANPPSKLPMLTLLKQARAFGLGVVLATQNPVDLDYKGLSNAGTWFLGRLQTERDKARVLEGLEGASTAAGRSFDRGKMEQTLSALGSRVFLMNNVHEDEACIFQTRFALSFLRGPLARDQIQKLMAPRQSAAPAVVAPTSALPESGARPVLPPGIEEAFVPRRGSLAAGTKLIYRPTLCGQAKVHFAQASQAIDVTQSVCVQLGADGIASLAWEESEITIDDVPEAEASPEADGQFATLPAELSRPKKFQELAGSLRDHLYRAHRLTLYRAAGLKQTSKLGESEGDFRVRLTQMAKEQRDLQVEKLRAKYAPKLATVQEQIRKAQQRLEKEQSQANSQMFNTAVTVGTSILAGMFGRKLNSAANVGRAATSVRAASKIGKERQDVAQANESIAALQEKLAGLDEEFKAETEKLQAAWDVEQLKLEPIEIAPKKTDVAVEGVRLVWTPWQQRADGTASRV